jgi:hypothetical protein
MINLMINRDINAATMRVTRRNELAPTARLGLLGFR